jgi:hypothetical protein
MENSTFHEETIKVIRHLQRRLVSLVDTAHTAEHLKNIIHEYLETLLQAGPHHIDKEIHRQPATRKDPPHSRIPCQKFLQFTTRNPHDLAQKMVLSPGRSRFSSPSDRETVFHGIRIPPGCDVIELPSVRPHVKDFFFVEGNVRHFVSVDDRPTSESSPSDRVIFHSTCPQHDTNKLIARVPKGYRIHKPYLAVCPMDERDYDVEDNLSDSYITPEDNTKRTTPPCCSRTASNECKMRRIVNIPEINPCERGQGIGNFYDTYGKHSYYHYPEKIKIETKPSKGEEYREKKLSVRSKGVKSHDTLCGHWSCTQRNATSSQARVLDDEDLFSVDKEGSPFPKVEHTTGCAANEVEFNATEIANVQVKVEESISNYEKRLRQKYDTNTEPVLEIEHTCSRRHGSDQHHADVAKFEKQLNEKYSTQHSCGKEEQRLGDCMPEVKEVKKETLASSDMSELDERIRGITEGVKQNSNDIKEDSTIENMGDETFMKRILRVDPVRPNRELKEPLKD